MISKLPWLCIFVILFNHDKSIVLGIIISASVFVAMRNDFLSDA